MWPSALSILGGGRLCDPGDTGRGAWWPGNPREGPAGSPSWHLPLAFLLSPKACPVLTKKYTFPVSLKEKTIVEPPFPRGPEDRQPVRRTGRGLEGPIQDTAQPSRDAETRPVLPGHSWGPQAPSHRGQPLVSREPHSDTRRQHTLRTAACTHCRLPGPAARPAVSLGLFRSPAAPARLGTAGWHSGEGGAEQCSQRSGESGVCPARKPLPSPGLICKTP